jgi:membrane protein
MGLWRQMVSDMVRKRFVSDLYFEIGDDYVFNGAAALAFYWILAIFPAAIFLLSLLPFLPIPHLKDAILDLVSQGLPRQAAGLIRGVISEVTSKASGGLLSFGLLFTLWSASNGLYAVMQQLNITYDVKEERSFWKTRGIALLLTLMFLVMIVSAFSLVVFGGVVQDWLASFIGRYSLLFVFFAALRWVIIIALVLMGFAVIYYFGPDVEQRFEFITPGSILGAALMIAASVGFRYYVSNFGDYSATYGSIGAVIVLLLWFYIAGFVILLGSEVNALLEHYNPEGKVKGQKREP